MSEFAVMPMTDYVGICDSVREKTGDTETIKSGEMSDKISEVYSAGREAEYDNFWDAFQLNGQRKQYIYAFAGCLWTKETLKPKYLPIIFPTEPIATSRYCLGMFAYFNRGKSNAEEPFDLSELLSKIDFSNCRSADNVFQNAYAKNITCDFSNCEKLNKTFDCSDGGNIENINIKVSAKCTTYSSTFNYWKGTEIRFIEGSVIAANISFAQASALTDESVDSIVNALKDLTGSTSKTLTVHANVYDRMVELGKDVLVTAKNWTLVKA